MKTLWRRLGVVGFALALAGCQRPPANSGDWLARVGSVEIRAADVDTELQRRQRTGAQATAGEVLDDLVTREALLATARRRGLDREPELLRAWENLLIAKLKERELEPQLAAPQPRAAEVAVKATELPSRASAPAELHLAILKWRTDRFTTDEKRQRLREHLQEARRKAGQLDPSVRDFGPLAAEYSEDPASRHRGGDVGWMPADPNRSRWESVVTEAGNRLAEVGAISEVVEGREGFYLLRLIERREAGVLGAKPSASSAQSGLSRQQRHEIEAAFVAAARKESAVVMSPRTTNTSSDGHRP